MPEKKSVVAEFLKGVFKIKKSYSNDIVYQAEKVIADYVARRRNEIISKYSKKRHRALSLVIVAASGALIYFVYRIIAC